VTRELALGLPAVARPGILVCMNVRTWQQASTLMAAADEPLSETTLSVALRAAFKRWEPLSGHPPALLAGAEHLDAARELAAHPLLEVTEVREVEGLREGWAVAWMFAPVAEGEDAPDAA
jgi:hypothetical protein